MLLLLLLVALSLPAGGNELNIVTIGDTQYYSCFYPYNFLQQVDWILQCRHQLDIGFVSHLGDIVENQNANYQQWVLAYHAIDSIIKEGIPDGICIGNHDAYDALDYTDFDHFFPPSLWQPFSWYGGSYPAGTDHNSYQLFTSNNGVETLWIHLEMYSGALNYSWVAAVLSAHPNTPTFVSTHAAGSDCPGNSVEPLIGTLLASYCNILAVFGGHYFECGGEHVSIVQNGCGRQVPVVVANFQQRPSGGDGWLRYYEFSDGYRQLCAYTYSPLLNQIELDSSSYFSVALNSSSSAVNTTGCSLPAFCVSDFVPPCFMLLVAIESLIIAVAAASLLLL